MGLMASSSTLSVRTQTKHIHLHPPALDKASPDHSSISRGHNSHNSNNSDSSDNSDNSDKSNNSDNSDNSNSSNSSNNRSNRNMGTLGYKLTWLDLTRTQWVLTRT